MKKSYEEKKKAVTFAAAFTASMIEGIKKERWSKSR